MTGKEKLTSVGSPTAFLIGAKLREAREEQKISLTEMAKRLGYTKSYLSGVENGKERATEALVRHYEKELELPLGVLSEVIQTLRTDTSFTLMPINEMLIKNASTWLDNLQNIILVKPTETDLRRLDHKEQVYHLELALKNALERGLAPFHTSEGRDQYREVLTILVEQGPQNTTFIQQILHMLTLKDEADFTEFNKIFNILLFARSRSRLNLAREVDAAPYLDSFFEALLAELYIDPLFRDRMSNKTQVRAAKSMHRSLAEVVRTLREAYSVLKDNYTPGQFEQDVQAYITHIERTLRYLKLVGVVPKERTNIDPELDGIFIPLWVEYQAQSKTFTNQTIVDALEHFSYLVLLGGPGSGKSTLVRHLAWSHVVANESDSTLFFTSPLLSGKPLPLRIELRRLNEDRKQRPDYDFLMYASDVLLGRAGLSISPQMFDLLLERRAMLILFDGLDEVATLDDRRILVDEIESLARRYPGNRFLVTSRPVGYELAPLSGQIFSHAQLQPFDDQQIESFLEHWYTYVLRLSPIPPSDQQELEELFTTLKVNQRLRNLAENPLLLTVITALHRYERLPDKRIFIYDRCADLLLETWARLKGTDMRWRDLKLSKDDQYACIAHLGYVLHERSQRQENTKNNNSYPANSDVDVPSRFILQEIEHFLHQQGLFASKAEEHLQAQGYLNLIQVEAGLIVERGSNEEGEPLYGFVHRTFQEYFAAADVYERYQQEDDPTIISEFLKKHLHDPHWREVILLLFGKLKRKPVTIQLRQILDGKIRSVRSKYTDIVQQDLFFVADCLIEEISVESELATLIISQLIKLATSSPFPSQRLEASDTLGSLIGTRQYGTLAQLRLKDLVSQNQLDITTRIEAAKVLFQHSVVGSDEEQIAIRILVFLIQSADLSIEQTIQAAQALYQFSSEGSENEHLAVEVLRKLLQRLDLSVEQTLQAAQALHQFSSEGSENERLATEKLQGLAQGQKFAADQRLQMGVYSALEEANYSEIAKTVNLLLSSTQTDIAQQNLKKFWQSILSLSIPNLSDILYIVELIKQEMLPIETRDEMYRILRQMVPQFDKLESVEA